MLASNLLPDETLVKVDVVLRQHGANFGLKGSARVDFGLRVEVGDELGAVVEADGEGEVFALPAEFFEVRALGFNPLLGLEFQLGDDTLDAFHLAEVEGEMDVIVQHCRTHEHVVRPRKRFVQARVHARAHVGCHPRPAIFCAEDRVDQHTVQFHAGEYTTRHERF